MARRAPVDPPSVPELAWRDWLARFAGRYHVSASSADHVTIIGPTGTGKTTIAFAIASLRKYVVALGTKPRDAEMAKIARAGGYHFQASPELPSPRFHPRVLVWPLYRGRTDREHQREAFRYVFDQAWLAGGWHVLAEEGPHLVRLGLGEVVREHMTMARTLSSGLIVCAQRPRGMPLEVISGAQHLLFFGTNDDDDIKRIGGMNGVSSAHVRQLVAGLGRGDRQHPERYRFLHVDTRDGSMTISRWTPW